MFLVYAALGGAWGWLCYKHVHELLPIQVFFHLLYPPDHPSVLQYYLSGLVGLVVIEMVANWGKFIPS